MRRQGTCKERIKRGKCEKVAKNLLHVWRKTSRPEAGHQGVVGELVEHQVAGRIHLRHPSSLMVFCQLICLEVRAGFVSVDILDFLFRIVTEVKKEVKIVKEVKCQKVKIMKNMKRIDGS